MMIRLALCALATGSVYASDSQKKLTPKQRQLKLMIELGLDKASQSQGSSTGSSCASDYPPMGHERLLSQASVAYENMAPRVPQEEEPLWRRHSLVSTGTQESQPGLPPNHLSEDQHRMAKHALKNLPSGAPVPLDSAAEEAWEYRSKKVLPGQKRKPRFGSTDSGSTLVYTRSDHGSLDFNGAYNKAVEGKLKLKKSEFKPIMVRKGLNLRDTRVPNNSDASSTGSATSPKSEKPGSTSDMSLTSGNHTSNTPTHPLRRIPGDKTKTGIRLGVRTSVKAVTPKPEKRILKRRHSMPTKIDSNVQEIYESLYGKKFPKH